MKSRDAREMKKLLRITFFLIVSASVVSAQTLVELAKKEKERRAALKGRSARIITNAELARQRRAPALEIVSAGPGGQSVGGQEEETGTTGYAEEPGQGYPRVRYGPGGGEPDAGGFARAAMEGTAFVENPGYALQYPDGKYAEISLQGTLELDFIARNGPGDDIAIFARRSGSRDGKPIEEGMPAGELELWGMPGLLFYGVLVLTDRGEWRELGTGVGLSSPEKFDLADIERISAVRIIYVMPRGVQNQGEKALSQASNDFTIGIDAVQALH
jgi:hypothetical protein